MSSYFLTEDGVDYLALEDGSGRYVQEDGLDAIKVPFVPATSTGYVPTITTVPNTWSYSFYFMNITSTQGVIQRVTGASSTTFTATITTAGTPGVATGTSHSFYTLDIRTNAVPESFSHYVLDEISEGFAWTTQPDYVAAGAVAAGTSSIVVPYPSGLALNDTLICIVESFDSTFVNVSGAFQGFRTRATIKNTGVTRLTVMMKAHWVASESSLFLSGGGGHLIGRMFALRGAWTYPNYVGPGTTGTASGTNQTISFDGTIANVAECIILLALAHGIDMTTPAASWSGYSNDDLIVMTERFDDATNLGDGGGIALMTAFIKHAFPDPMNATTAVSALTNPPYAGVHLAIQPINPPVNDNFANAIVIDFDIDLDDPGALSYDSWTYNATKETSEVITNPDLFGTNLRCTAWWKFSPERRQIVSVQVRRDEPTGYNTGDLFCLPRQGTAANNVSNYAPTTINNATSFGSGDGSAVSASYQLFNDFSDDRALRIQVIPGKDLYLQTGIRDLSYAHDYKFHLEATINQPPDEDDFEDARVLADGISDTYTFNLDYATGQPGFLPHTNYARSLGDVWFKIQPTVDRKFGFRIVRDLLPLEATNEHLIAELYSGTSLGDLVFIASSVGGAEGVEKLHAAADLIGGQTYFIVIYITSTDWFGANTHYPLTGVLDYRFFDKPSNDDFADAEDLGTNDSGSTNVVVLGGATNEVGEPFLSGFYTQYLGPSIWYEFTPTTGGWYQFSFAIPPDSGLSLYLIAYRGTTLANIQKANFDFISYYARTPTLALRGGETYKLQLAMFGDQPFAPDFETMSWTQIESPASASDDFANRDVLTGASGVEAFTMRGGTNQENEWPPYYWWEPPDATTWFEWTCPADGCYYFEMDAGNTPSAYYWQTSMGIYYDDPFDLVDHKVCGNENGTAFGNTKVAFDATNGTTYYIQCHLWKDFIENYNDPDPTDEYNYNPFQGNLNWGPYTKATNHLFADAIALSGDSGYVSGETFGLDINLEAGVLADGMTLDEVAAKMNGFSSVPGPLPSYPVGRMTWYQYSPPYTGRYVWKFNQNNFNHSIWVHFFQGTVANDLERALAVGSFGYFDQDEQIYFAGDYIQQSDDHWIYVDMVAGETYYLAVGGFLWDNADDAAFYEESFWTLADMYQSSWEVAWALIPPDNDTYSSVRNNTNNLGNLNYYTNYTDAEHPTGIGLVSTGGSGGARSGTLVGGSAESGEPAHAGIAATRSVWYKLVVNPSGSYKIWVEPEGVNPALDPRIAIYAATSSVSTLGAALASDNDSGPGLYPEITVSLTAGTVYMIAVDGDLGTFKINWQLQPVGIAPPNDNVANAEVLTDSTPVVGSTIYATVEGFELPVAQPITFFGGAQGGPYGSVWYQWTATTTGSVIVSVDFDVGGTNYVDIYRNNQTTNIVSTAYSNGTTIGAIINIPVGVTAGDVLYIRVSGTTGATFGIEMLVQSTTPPGNDNDSDAEDAVPVSGTGTFPGSTDGSTVQSNEADPKGGALNSLAGTTWHKYVAPADGFIAAWVSRDSPKADWYRIGVWEGTSAASSIVVPPYQDQPTTLTETSKSWSAFYDVKAGYTYLIQVIRDPLKPFGDYDLHIDEYLETNEWIFPTDGFDSTTGDIEVDGNLIRCTGSQAIGDSLDVTPQYGTIDLGADTKRFFRELRIHFDVRIVGGQVLYRPMWYGDDDTNNFALASDDHVNYTTATLGLLRMRDINGDTRISVYLNGSGPRNGENQLIIRTYMTNPSGYAPLTTLPVSLGSGMNQHDTGWVSVEILFVNFNNNYGYDGYTNDQFNNSTSLIEPLTRVYAWVNGRPGTSYLQQPDPGPQIRYVDWGMFRHPSMIYANDQRYVENNEAWTLEMRNMRVTNKCLLRPYDTQLADDHGITQYDGFSTGKRWSVNPPQTVMATYPNTAIDPIETMPTKTWKSIHATGGNNASLTYNSQHGSGRTYAASWYFDALPLSPMVLARYGFAGYAFSPTNNLGGKNQRHGLGALILHPDGELRIRPYSWKEYCVAHLETGKHYFIEVHTDFRNKHDVTCTVFINQTNMGTYSSAYSWADVLAVTASGPLPRWSNIDFSASTDTKQDLVFGGPQSYGSNSQFTLVTHDMHYTNTLAGRDPGNMIGAVQTVIMPAATAPAEGGHLYIPEPDETFEMRNEDETNYATLYGWQTEVTSAGPYIFTDLSSGHDRFENVLPATPRFWEPYFRLYPVHPQLIAGGDYTVFGLSVPVDVDAILGIIVRAPTGRTVQLIKGGSPAGSTGTEGDPGVYGSETDLWGTTWTPQELNALDFGVTISGGAINPLQVSVEVLFKDEGGPENIGRGPDLPAAGLYNVWGDTLVAEFYAASDLAGSAAHLGGFWSGGEPGNGPRGGHTTLSTTPGQYWGCLSGMWLWQSRGNKSPSVDWTGTPGSGTLTVTDFRCVRNALVMPRFAYSSDNGATWTWMVDPLETDSVDHIGGDVAAISGGDALFLDNAAHLMPFSHDGGGWSSGFFEDRPTSSPAYAYPWYQVRYGNDGTSETAIIAVNVYLSTRSYNGYPKVDSGSGNSAIVMQELPDGNVSRVGTFAAGGTISSPYTTRNYVARAPGNQAWTPTNLGDTIIRLGDVPQAGNDAFALRGSQVGVVVYAASYELLVPATPDPPPSGCFNIVPMNWRSSDRHPVITRVHLGDKEVS